MSRTLHEFVSKETAKTGSPKPDAPVEMRLRWGAKHAGSLSARRTMGKASFDPRDRRDGREWPEHYDGKRWTFHQPYLAHRVRFMCRSGGYVMVRKPGAVPFVVSEKLWAAFPLWTDPLPADRETER